MSDNRLRQVNKWYGSHRGVSFEVSQHDLEGAIRSGGIWCYYLYIMEKRAPKSFENEFWLARSPPRAPGAWDDRMAVYPYMSASFAGVYWHGGITFYEKWAGFDGSMRSVKIGCDYNHLWDEGGYYDESSVASDARRTVDELIQSGLLEEEANG